MPSLISVTDVNSNNFDITTIQQLDNIDIKQIVLFYEPIQILNIKIIKDRGDTNKYIISLYTNQFVINVDNDVYITEEKFDRMEKSSRFAHFNLNLRDIEFIRGTVQLQPKFGAVNTITSVRDITPLEYYMDALDICDNNLKKTITDCNQNDLFCKQEMKVYRELKRTCNTQINNSSNQENEDLKNQIDSNNQENQDLKQQLESKNQEIKELKKHINSNNKNSNNSQSTQTTTVIICVLIIIILVGLCIYLYFF
jgi:hypothetical protein